MSKNNLVYVDDQDFTLYVGDARDVLAGLPAESVHCVVTSPPYWGLRDYGTGLWEGGDEGCDHVAPARSHAGEGLAKWSAENARGGAHVAQTAKTTRYANACGKCGARRVDQQLGLEPTPDEYVQNMVAVFREVRRVLRADGTCWLNIGDSYNANGRDGHGTRIGAKQGTNRASAEGLDTNRPTDPSLKPKDLVGIPWRLAFALQADGWYLRSDIIWAKPNPMPESVTDRPTKAHEYLFLLTRSARYYFDQDAIREKYVDPEDALRYRVTGDVPGQTPHGATRAKGPDGRKVTRVVGADGSIQHRDGERWPNAGRNKRSVWEIATEPYPDAHFATFPQALVEPCILAGTSERGCCPECGAPWERETEQTPMVVRPTPKREAWQSEDDHARTQVGGTVLAAATSTTIGWCPTCDHEHEPVPCTVADIFMGSGTTALVARRLGRKSIGVELSPEYTALCADRLKQLSLFA